MYISNVRQSGFISIPNFNKTKNAFSFNTNITFYFHL